MKTCSKCKTPKEESEFNKCLAAKSGLNYYCKLCSCKVARKSAKDNRVEIREKRRANPGPSRKATQKWRDANKDRVKKKAHNDYWKDPVKSREKNNEYAKADREAKRIAENDKYHADPGFKILKILRSRITTALKRGKAKKSIRTMELLGCPWVWAEVHLESLFKPGMTWENHGPVWHIDHVKPCAAFDLRDPDQQRACFHWTNLQPLFALENLQKSDKYDPCSPEPANCRLE